MQSHQRVTVEPAAASQGQVTLRLRKKSCYQQTREEGGLRRGFPQIKKYLPKITTITLTFHIAVKKLRL